VRLKIQQTLRRKTNEERRLRPARRRFRTTVARASIFSFKIRFSFWIFI